MRVDFPTISPAAIILVELEWLPQIQFGGVFTGSPGRATCKQARRADALYSKSVERNLRCEKRDGAVITLDDCMLKVGINVQHLTQSKPANP